MKISASFALILLIQSANAVFDFQNEKRDSTNKQNENEVYLAETKQISDEIVSVLMKSLEANSVFDAEDDISDIKAKLNKKLDEAQVDVSGEKKEWTEPKPISRSLYDRLRTANPKIHPQALVNLGALIEAGLNDEETRQIAKNLKRSQEIIDLRNRLDDARFVEVLLKIQDDMYAMQVLFENPARAFVDLRINGKIEKENIEKFKGNPQGYADMIQLQVWFNFIKVASAGDYF